jgi:hypothetical protein
MQVAAVATCFQFKRIAAVTKVHMPTVHGIVIIIIINLNQPIASTTLASRPSGAATGGSTAPECLQLLRTSQA